MDMKHLSETASYEDSWAEANKPEPEAPKASEPEPAPAEAPAPAEPAVEPTAEDLKRAGDTSYEDAWAKDEPKAGIDPRVAANTAAPEPKRFSDAFRDARKAGLKTFTWQGKNYTTQLASDKPKAKPATPAAKPESKPAAKPAFNQFAKVEAPAKKPEPAADAPLMQRVAAESDAMMADMAKPVSGRASAPNAAPKPAPSAPSFDDGRRFAGANIK